jgi:hypothetical protein
MERKGETAGMKYHADYRIGIRRLTLSQLEIPANKKAIATMTPGFLAKTFHRFFST